MHLVGFIIRLFSFYYKFLSNVLAKRSDSRISLALIILILFGEKYSRTSLIRTLIIRIANLPNRFGPSGKFIENSTQLTCLKITCYRIIYSTVLWLLELQIRRGRKVKMPVHVVNSNSRTSDCHCSLFSQKNPLIRVFCLSGWLAFSVNPDNWSSTVQPFTVTCYFLSSILTFRLIILFPNILLLHLMKRLLDGAAEDGVIVGKDSRCPGLYSTENL